MGNPKIQAYGAVPPPGGTRLIKLVNPKRKLKSSLIFDEVPAIYLHLETFRQKILHMDCLLVFPVLKNPEVRTLDFQNL